MSELHKILKIENLNVVYKTRRGDVKAVRNVNLDLIKGETLAVMGESGSGKTTLAMTILRLLPDAARVLTGKVIYSNNGKEVDLLKLDDNAMRKFRWKEIAMVFQAAQNAFNPLITIWEHVKDTYRDHGIKVSKNEMLSKVEKLMEFVQLDSKRVLNSYPHELSGGMKQRTLIALALLLDPKVLILDEPTTALDILTQRNILELLKSIKKNLSLSMILISHDLAIAAELADRIVTFYAGAMVELGNVNDIFYDPKHPYTQGLIRSVPTVSKEKQLYSIPGSPPDLVNLPDGCKFAPRCKFVAEKCRKEEPRLDYVKEGHYVACYRWRDIENDSDN